MNHLTKQAVEDLEKAGFSVLEYAQCFTVARGGEIVLRAITTTDLWLFALGVTYGAKLPREIAALDQALSVSPAHQSAIVNRKS